MTDNQPSKLDMPQPSKLDMYQPSKLDMHKHDFKPAGEWVTYPPPTGLPTDLVTSRRLECSCGEIRYDIKSEGDNSDTK